MLHYKFPEITHIDQVLPHIEGDSAFGVFQRYGGYTIIDYNFISSDTFPVVENEDDIRNKMRRECRGLIFDTEGKLISRRYHKFKNLGENEELLPENVDFDEPHIITEKLDGSMCSPALINGKIEWITRMGITFISEQVEAWLKADLVRNKNYTRFAEAMIHQNSTPIFEWCSRKNRVVIDHPVDMLVLTAIRWNDTGRYCSLGYFNFVAENFNIEVVKTFDYDAKNILDIVRSQENTEGVVIRFNDGHMIKCKSDWYVSIHRAKSFITNERQVTKAIVEGTIDDVLPLLPVEDRDMVTTFQKKLFDIISRKTIRFHQLAKERIDMFPTPKEYALSDKFKRDVNLLTTLMFSVYNKKIELVVETVHEHIINYMKRHLNNTKNYDDMKTLLFPRLDYRFEYQEN